MLRAVFHGLRAIWRSWRAKQPGRNNEQTTEDPAANPRDDAGEEATEPGTRPGGNGGRQTSSTISIRFMTPWTNSSAIMHAGNATDSMKLVKNYCGWFESKVPAPGEGQSAQIYFTQTLGGTPYGAEGINNSDTISLDSILATGATTVSPDDTCISISAACCSSIVMLISGYSIAFFTSIKSGPRWTAGSQYGAFSG